MSATQAGWRAFRRYYSNPNHEVREQAFEQRVSAYRLLWAYYNGSMFEAIWRPYIAHYHLYRNIRLLYNKAPGLVEFYVNQLYPGVLSEDGQSLPDGMSLAIPFTQDTPPEIKRAVAQLWQWSNWQAKKGLQIRYAAALGSVLCEVIDDVERRKISIEVLWPGLVKDLRLDSAGNVISYILEYQATDAKGVYLYRKEVDKQAIHYFRDDRPYDYGNGAEIANPYGFAPAAWIKHRDVGGLHGEPVTAGMLGKIDELNGLVSHTHDHIHRAVDAPMVLWGGKGIQSLAAATEKRPTRQSATGEDESAYEAEEITLLQGPAGGKAESLLGDLNIADANATIEMVRSEIKSDYPELSYYEALRQMSTATGPAIQRLLGDVANKVLDVQGTYDAGNLSLYRMALAIGGERVNSGAWGPRATLTRQQQKFLPFDLTSYQRGQLDMALAPRLLVVPTKLEQAQERQAFWQSINAAVQAGVPLEVALEAAGWTPVQIARLQDTRAQQIQRDQLLAQEDVIPSVSQ